MIFQPTRVCKTIAVLAMALALVATILGVRLPIRSDDPAVEDGSAIGRPSAGQAIVQATNAVGAQTLHSEPLPVEMVSLRTSIRFRAEPKSAAGRGSPYAPEYAELHLLASAGDPIASFMLSRLLDSCEIQPHDQSIEEFDSEIDLIRQTHTMELIHNGKRERVRISDTPGNLESIIELKTMQYHTCNDISPEQRSESSRWLEYAAENGAGLTALWESARKQQNADEREAALNAVWNSGDHRALGDLSVIAYRRYLSGEDPNGHVVHYAYQLAHAAINGRMSSFPGNPEAGLEGLEELQRRLQLHDYQQREAVEIAVQMINRNENCCYMVR